jgi:hypothetical protein
VLLDVEARGLLGRAGQGKGDTIGIGCNHPIPIVSPFPMSPFPVSPFSFSLSPVSSSGSLRPNPLRSWRPVADDGPGNLPDVSERIPPIMDRPFRAFQPAAVPLEGRILLAHMHVPPPALPPQTSSYNEVFFETPAGSEERSQQVAQQVGEATVWLRRSYTLDTAQVQVATDPSSPAVGVNLPAVNQTVTFAVGQTLASATFPINAGAPNPGEVDVNLTLTPVGWSSASGLTGAWGPLELRILAPDATTPPRIIGVAGTPHGIELTFSKPMNPVQASNVHNYTVHVNGTTILGNDDFLSSILGVLSPDNPIGGTRTSSSTKSVPLRSANYDPADFTVTLIPRRRLTALGSTRPGSPSFVVTPGSPAKTSALPRDGSSSAQGLADLEGNAINQGSNPGNFRILVNSGYTPVG